MKVHFLKTVPPFFAQVASGEKTFELRKNDRDFQNGDILNLKEWIPSANAYTGKVVLVKVKYLLEGYSGLESGYCIMGISVMSDRP